MGKLHWPCELTPPVEWDMMGLDFPQSVGGKI